jgi:hypothetical protein
MAASQSHEVDTDDSAIARRQHAEERKRETVMADLILWDDD